MPIEDGRQVSPTLAGIRRDHRERYRFAAGFIPDGGWVLDIACGIGYGSWMMAQLARPALVVGVDICAQTIAYGLQHYPHPRVVLMRADALALDLGGQRFDAVVSFETLEHIAQDRLFLERLKAALAPGGTLIVSTPNQEVLPFDASYYAHHLRHYRSAEFCDLLTACGLEVMGSYAQHDDEVGDITLGFGGAFDIAVCRDAGCAFAERQALACLSEAAAADLRLSSGAGFSETGVM